MAHPSSARGKWRKSVDAASGFCTSLRFLVCSAFTFVHATTIQPKNRMRAQNKAACFDRRSTLSRSDARKVYDAFARTGHTGGNDASSNYGGPAIKALVEMADFSSARSVLDYGCGQGKLAEYVLSNRTLSQCGGLLNWHGIDQSPVMVEKFRDRCCTKRLSRSGECTVELLKSGDALGAMVRNVFVDRFVSTYCLDLLSEEEMYKVLDLAESVLDPKEGRILLAGITWGYRDSIKTAAMTCVWELLYLFWRKKVGGCRPQNLEPYLKAKGWKDIAIQRTKPIGFPWMISEVICARHPAYRLVT